MTDHRLWLACLAAATVFGLGGPGPAVAAPYGFEDQSIGAATPLTASINGVSATFSGPSGVDPDAFEVSYNSTSGPFGAPYRTLTTSFLTVGNAFGAIGAPLRIAFAAPVTSISLLFALDDPANTTALSLTTDAGGTATARGALATGFRYPEGTLSYAGPAFTVLTLASLAPDFQIDGITVAASALPPSVPEPAGLAVLGTGLAALPILRRRGRA